MEKHALIEPRQFFIENKGGRIRMACSAIRLQGLWACLGEDEIEEMDVWPAERAGGRRARSNFVEWMGVMRRLLPNRMEMAIFAALAAICAAIVAYYGTYDLGLSAMAVPLFIAAAIMGMRRNDQLRSSKDGSASFTAGESMIE